MRSIKYIVVGLVAVSISAFSQKVGIGTNTPVARLHVEVPAGVTYPVFKVNQFKSSVPFLIILPNGNIGIGVSNPSEALDISGSIKFSGALMPGGNPGSYGFVLISQGPGTSPIWMDPTILGDNWGNQVAVTHTPLIGDGTSINPISLQNGTTIGEVLFYNGTQWLIKEAPWDSVCNIVGTNYIMKWTGSELCNSQILDNGLNIGIGTSNPHNSAKLDIKDTLRGLLLPRLTTTQRNSISNPAHSLLIFNLDINCFEWYDSVNGTWRSLCSGGGSCTDTIVLFFDSFNTSLNGWSFWYGWGPTCVNSSCAPYNKLETNYNYCCNVGGYSLSLNNSDGLPAPSAWVSGDNSVAYAVRPGIQKTVTLPSNRCKVILEYNYRVSASIGYAASAWMRLEDVATNTVLIDTVHRPRGAFRDTGWEFIQWDLTSWTNGVSQLKIILHTADGWIANHNIQAKWDNIRLKIVF